ncbi:MAG: nucleotidyl transferase AbiEii/AbiGii toxin family protein [Clostridia bacterium]|nr:nucleotidyl transferase AbiEii/AbiGii toxin family protein [Clostridia bacterium]
MHRINQENLILEKDIFMRTEIEKRMTDGGFNSLSKFELFIWDLEMFLQLQKKLGNKIILKGGAATQFYIPVIAQRTSIDIDMICLTTREEVHNAISEIGAEFNGEGEYCRLKIYEPKNPKLGLDALETYFETVPSICDDKELFATRGKQEVKIEFMYSEHEYAINKIKQPELFALETEREFNVLAFENLFAEKLTTLGPTTIGVSDERADEQFKQIYDVITLFTSNMDQVFSNKELIKLNYEKAAKIECQIHGITYKLDQLFEDLKLLINRVKNIENDSSLMQMANDFQGLYLRKVVNRDKAQWAIVGYQLDILADYIFLDCTKVLQFREIEELIEKLKFKNVQGSERGIINKEVRNTLQLNFGTIEGLSTDLFRKRIDRIIWELVNYVVLDEIQRSVINISCKC